MIYELHQYSYIQEITHDSVQKDLENYCNEARLISKDKVFVRTLKDNGMFLFRDEIKTADGLSL